MSKTTMGNKLPLKLEQKMQTVGEQIKLARLRRNLSVVQVAERATCSPLTVSRIEKGAPTVAIGIYLRVLYALQLDDDILLLAKKDEIHKCRYKNCFYAKFNAFFAIRCYLSEMFVTFYTQSV